MGARLTAAEAVLHRTGPNNITVLFEAQDGFDPARALRGVHMLAEGAERFRSWLSRGRFVDAGAVDWPCHVSVLDTPGVTACEVMDMSRRLALPLDRPLWRVVLVNPDGRGWSGVVLHFDHAIADGTRIARHLVSNVRPAADDLAPIHALPWVSMADLRGQSAPRLDPAPVGLCRIPFAPLRRAVLGAASHGDALLRLARRALDADPVFAGVPARRKDHAAVAKIEALHSGGRLGNHAQMQVVDLSRPSGAGESALFQSRRTPMMEKLRMGSARLVPAGLLRPIVRAEFSRPGIVLTIVPVSRKSLPLFGLPLTAIYPAAPALGRPLMALTAVRLGDGFDASVTAHGPGGEVVPGLSERVAAAMEAGVQ